MATAKRPAGGPPATRAPKHPSGAGATWKGVAALSVGVVVVAVCVVGALAGNDDSTAVPPPTVTERNDTVPILRKAAESQGICYGWRLADGAGRVVNIGSNLGDGAAVDDNPGCPRWVQVVADITYTSESSESEDYAFVTVEGSPDIDRSDLLAVDSGLNRFGLAEDAFLDDPGWAVTRAAVTLPLLLAETGAVDPPPVVTAVPSTHPSPLPDAGNDLWRDRWSYLLGAAGLLLITVLLATVGLVQRHRQRRAAPPGRREGTESAATPASGRTPEKP